MLVPLAHEIFEKRKKFIADFMPLFAEYYSVICGKHELIGINYQSQLLEGTMEHFLEYRFKQDLATQRTNHGTHKDDLEFTLFNQPIKKYGSQGQQKTFIFSLKLAQYQYSLDKTSIKPILLLDDVCERLDQSRLENLMSLIASPVFGQVFISDTSTKRIQKVIPVKKDELSLFEMGK